MSIKENYEVKKISRTLISKAAYNPRRISKENAKKLKESLETFGLVEPLIWNSRTGNLVSGHQRLTLLDKENKAKDYEITVSVIDVDELTEKKLNVVINNQTLMGEFDADMIFDLVAVGDLSFSDLGFDDQQAEIMFGENERFDEIFSVEENEEYQDVKDNIQAIKDLKKRRKEQEKADSEQTNAEWYFTVVCLDEADKRRILKALGIPGLEDYVLSSAFERILKK